MIVVVGSPIGRLEAGITRAGGRAARIALSAAASGRSVQLIGRIGDDPTADAVVLDLAQRSVGHVALLRDMSHPTPIEASADDPADIDDVPGPDQTREIDGLAIDAADVTLGLRYLTGFEVVVLANGSNPQLVAAVSDAATWAEARLVLVLDRGLAPPSDLPTDAVAFEAPEADPDGAFAALVARFAVGLDAGTEADAAFRASVEADGWTVAQPG